MRRRLEQLGDWTYQHRRWFIAVAVAFIGWRIGTIWL